MANIHISRVDSAWASPIGSGSSWTFLFLFSCINHVSRIPVVGSSHHWFKRWNIMLMLLTQGDSIGVFKRRPLVLGCIPWRFPLTSFFAVDRSTSLMNSHIYNGAVPNLFFNSPSSIFAQNQTQLFTQFITGEHVGNSVVVGPQNRQYFTITTSPSSPGFTVIKNNTSHDIGAISWQKHAFIEIPGIVARQTTKKWIGVAANLRFVGESLFVSWYSFRS